MDKVRKLFERLTSGRTGSPETRDLRERGRWGRRRGRTESTACSVSATGQEGRRKDRGRKRRRDVCESTA